MNILAVRRESVQEILEDHWAKYGRNYYSRHDYEAVETAKAEAVMSRLSSNWPRSPGRDSTGKS